MYPHVGRLCGWMDLCGCLLWSDGFLCVYVFGAGVCARARACVGDGGGWVRGCIFFFLQHFF